MANKKPLSVQIKGVRDGLLVTMGEGDWADLGQELLKNVQKRSGFFNGAKVSLEIGERILSASEITGLRDKLAEQNVGLWAVLSSSSVTEQTAQALGLATRLSAVRSNAEHFIQPLDTNIPGENAILIHRTLRSGFKISYEGHVTVIGDVNPGAEIIAGGNIIVWGRLRGLAHAGASGNSQSVVCALDLMPMQLRIADFIAIPPQRSGKPVPEIASIQNGQVVAEPWDINT